MRITGTLHSIGAHHFINGLPEDRGLSEVEIHGILITADDETLHTASNLLSATVDIYPHPVNGLVAGECTPENYAHALARLAHTEDHLAREVRSSQALAVALEDVQAQCTAILAKQEDLHEIRDRCCRDKRVTGEAFDRILELFGRLQKPPSDGLAFTISEVVRTAQGGGRDAATLTEILELLLVASRRIESDAAEIAKLREELNAGPGRPRRVGQRGLGVLAAPSPTSFDDEDDCDRYTPRGG